MDRRRSRKIRVAVSCVVIILAAVLSSVLENSFGYVIALLLLLFAIWNLARFRGFPILVYHSVTDQPDWLPWAKNISVRKEVFLRHMQSLASNGWQPMSSWEAAEARNLGKNLPKNTVILHFDDGYLDNLLHACPILNEFNYPATIFVSTDFIDPSTDIRNPTNTTDTRGYLNATELREIDSNPLFEIAAHGTNHARLIVTKDSQDKVTEANWTDHLELLWGLIQGSKSRWFEQDLGFEFAGEKVGTSQSALVTRMTDSDGKQEDAKTYERRVTSMFSACRSELETILGKKIRHFCWPFDERSDRAQEIAESVGFELFTGGRGENRGADSWNVQSRTHINDFAAGPAPVWVETLVFRAKLGLATGNLLWWPIVIVANFRRAKFHSFKHSPTGTAKVKASA